MLCFPNNFQTFEYLPKRLSATKGTRSSVLFNMGNSTIKMGTLSTAKVYPGEKVRQCSLDLQNESWGICQETGVVPPHT